MHARERPRRRGEMKSGVREVGRCRGARAIHAPIESTHYCNYCSSIVVVQLHIALRWSTHTLLCCRIQRIGIAYCLLLEDSQY